jgi:hypothetical protein
MNDTSRQVYVTARGQLSDSTLTPQQGMQNSDEGSHSTFDNSRVKRRTKKYKDTADNFSCHGMAKHLN